MQNAQSRLRTVLSVRAECNADNHTWLYKLISFDFNILVNHNYHSQEVTSISQKKAIIKSFVDLMVLLLDNLHCSHYNLTRIVSMVIWSTSHSEHDLKADINGIYPSFCPAGSNT